MGLIHESKIPESLKMVDLHTRIRVTKQSYLEKSRGHQVLQITLIPPPTTLPPPPTIFPYVYSLLFFLNPLQIIYFYFKAYVPNWR